MQCLYKSFGIKGLKAILHFDSYHSMEHTNKFFLLVCMIISLVPAGYANLISGMLLLQHCSQELFRRDTFILSYCSKLKLSLMIF
jgi:hypothetical protein